MKQGDIYYADLEPIKGREQSGKRPVVIISGNAMNENYDVVIICPISSKIKNYKGTVLLKKNKTNNLKLDSEVITFQIRTIDKNRFTKKIGQINNAELEEIITCLNEILYI